MTIEILAVLYFIFFFITNLMFLKICYKVMDKARVKMVVIYIVVFFNSTIFTIIAYGFNQLPIITYLMVLLGSAIELTLLFKNSLLGIFMYSFMATIYLMCIESIVISSAALNLGITLGELTHNHLLLFEHIVVAWLCCMVVSVVIYRFVPGDYLKIINQNREQVGFIIVFLLTTIAYLTFNSFIYANADTFDPLYLPIHQIVAPFAWLMVVNLAIALIIRFDYLHGYKVKVDLLSKTVQEQQSQLIKSKNMAERDSLVDLYNKVATEKKIKEALEFSKEGSFFVIDIDNFKGINDEKGHPHGDKVLLFLAKRLLNSFREDDILGRIGGDEFVVYIKKRATNEELSKKCNELCRIAEAPFKDEFGEKTNVSISIGVAVAPEGGVTFEDLYRNADRALYVSKKKGKNTYSIYE